MKFLIVQAPTGEAPVLFPRDFMHSYVAGLLSPMPVISAGFVRRSGDGIECYGRSNGLHIASRPGADTALVARLLDENAAHDAPR